MQSSCAYLQPPFGSLAPNFISWYSKRKILHILHESCREVPSKRAEQQPPTPSGINDVNLILKIRYTCSKVYDQEQKSILASSNHYHEAPHMSQEKYWLTQNSRRDPANQLRWSWRQLPQCLFDKRWVKCARNAKSYQRQIGQGDRLWPSGREIVWLPKEINVLEPRTCTFSWRRHQTPGKIL